MKLSNINKPTSPFWNKVAVSCAAASGFIAGYGLLSNLKGFMIAGGVLGIIGTVLPIFMNNNSK